MTGSSAGSPSIPFSFRNKGGLDVFWAKAVSNSEKRVNFQITIT